MVAVFALRKPRRRAQRQATELWGADLNGSVAPAPTRALCSSQRDQLHHAIVCEPDNPTILGFFLTEERTAVKENQLMRRKQHFNTFNGRF